MNKIIKYKYPDDALTNDNVSDYLKSEIPEFWGTRVQDDATEPHTIFGDFAIWLRDRLFIDDKEKDFGLIKRSCNLIQELVDRGNDDVLNVVEMTIFEILLDELQERYRYNAFRLNFKGEALTLLDRLRRERYGENKLLN